VFFFVSSLGKNLASIDIHLKFDAESRRISLDGAINHKDEKIKQLPILLAYQMIFFDLGGTRSYSQSNP